MILTNLIGKGAQADVYEYEGKAIKLFHMDYDKAYVFFEGAVTSIIEHTTLPISKIHDIVKINGQWAIVMDLLNGQTIATDMVKGMSDLVDMQIKIHTIDSPLPLNNHYVYKDEISAHPMLDKTDKDRLLHLLKSLPEGNKLCHNDYHGLNAIKNNTGVYVIDWINAKGGNPETDCCRTYILIALYNKRYACSYLDMYSSKAGFDPERILRWLPIVSAERLYEKNESEIPQLKKWIQGGK